MAVTACQLVRHLVLGAASCQEDPPALEHGLSWKLLRTQALQASARQLAATADALRDAVPGPLTDERCWAGAQCLAQAHALLLSLPAACLQPGSSKLLCAMAAGLAESCILDHAARLLLMLRSKLTPRARARAWVRCACIDYAAAYTNCCNLIQVTALPTFASIATAAGASTASAGGTAAQLAQALAGPCARHAVVVLALEALGALEGRAETPTAHCACLATPCVAGPADTRLLLGAVLSLRSSLAALPNSMAPRLLLRIGFAAVNARGTGGAGRSAGPRARAALAHQPDLLDTSIEALRAAVGHLGSKGPQQGEAAGAQAQEPAVGGQRLRRLGAEAWRLAEALLRPETLFRVGVRRALLGDCLMELFTACRGPLWDDEAPGGAGRWRSFPPEAPPLLAGVLSAGALPTLERLLRRTGEDSVGPEAVTLAGSAVGPPTDWGAALPLLAYAEPLQAAALAATATKLLRATQPEALLRHDRGASGCMGVAFVLQLLEALDRIPAERSAGEGAAAGLRGRLALVLSVGLPEWLPALSCLARHAAAQDAGECLQVEERARLRQRKQGRSAGGGAAASPTGLFHCLDLLLPACFLLVRGPHTARAAASAVTSEAAADSTAAAIASTAVSGSGSPSAAPTGGEASAAAGAASFVPSGWRWGVAQEVELRELVGAALALLQRRKPEAKDWERLCSSTAVWALGLARACPPELRSSGRGEGGLGWWPDTVRALPATLREECGREALAEAVEALAGELEAGRRALEGAEAHAPAVGVELAGAEGNVGRMDAEFETSLAVSGGWGVLGELLLPPEEARRRLGLPACSYPACANLSGAGEAALRLQQCGRCGRESYCCRECQMAHWRAGHKEACGSSGGAR